MVLKRLVRALGHTGSLQTIPILESVKVRLVQLQDEW